MTNTQHDSTSVSAAPSAEGPRPGGVTTLRRSDDRIVAGVCSGVAEAFGLDVTLVRLATVVVTLIGGLGPALYLAGWLLIPDRRGTVVAADLLGRASRRSGGRIPAPTGTPAGTHPSTHTGTADPTAAEPPRPTA